MADVASAIWWGSMKLKVTLKRVRPPSEHRDVGIGNTEKAAHDPHREPSVGLDKIPFAAGRYRLEAARRQLSRRGTDCLHCLRGERPSHQGPQPVVDVSLVREHQAAIPVPQRSLGDAHEIEDRETDARQPGITRQ